MNATAIARPPVWFFLVAVVALLWNLIGVGFYLGSVGVLGPPFVQPDQPVMPPWVTAAFAIGVFAGVFGCLGLLLTRRWAVGLLWGSLIGTVIDWGWVFANFGFAPLGIAVVVIAVLLVWLVNRASARGWLR